MKICFTILFISELKTLSHREDLTIKEAHAPYTPFFLWISEIHYCSESQSAVAKMGKASLMKTSNLKGLGHQMD
jgi:hypothetical protein